MDDDLVSSQRLGPQESTTDHAVVRKISNIYSSTAPSQSAPSSLSSPRRRPLRRILNRTISTYSAPSGVQRHSDGQQRRKSAYSSRHSDGSGSISIRYSIAPRGSAAYRSFSGASDLLASAINNDGTNDDELEYDECAVRADGDAIDAPVVDSQDGSRGEIAEIAQREYMSTPGFYFNSIGSNYNSSEEEPDDDSTDSDRFSAISLPPPPPIELDVVETGSVDDVQIYRMAGNSSDEDIASLGSEDNARMIEIDENGHYVTRSINSSVLGFDDSFDTDAQQHMSYSYAGTAGDTEEEVAHIADFDEDVTATHSIAFQQQIQKEDEAKAQGMIVHPACQYIPAEYANNYVYRTREVEENAIGVRQPERALIPVYSEGLSMSTFPYTNSMAPLSAMIIRQQPKGQFAAAMYRSSVLLPPLPRARNPDLVVTIGAEPAGADTKTELLLDDKASQNSPGVEEALDMLRQLEQARQIRHESMFEGPAVYAPYIPRSRQACSEGVARTVLLLCICFPPMFLVVGFGGLDAVVGEMPRREKFVARAVGACVFAGAIAGLVAGLVVGL
ncbi:uncharacterized protein V2V93DRAFT_365611 [Kockiozyma suomiensis]|uniref:uncharacterized protein n=1 Tax=Kockiozyma suomiensis TaxID=1337062 RepID=UPI003342F0B0